MSTVVWPRRLTALTSAPLETRYLISLVVAARGGVGAAVCVAVVGYAPR